MKLSSLEAIFNALNRAKVRFLVVGGVAVNAHGYGRNTFDLDLVIQLEPLNVDAAFEALGSAGYHPAQPVSAAQFGDPATRAAWIQEKGMVVLRFWSDAHPETPVDVFVAEPFDFDAEHRLALLQELAPGLIVPLVRVETLLSMKRAAGRLKDLADIDELNLLLGNPSSYDQSR